MKKPKRWPTLYGKASTGKVKVWRIWAEENGNGTATILTEHGYEDGEMQRATVTLFGGKNIGRANETNSFQQACLEATSKWNKKRDKKYVLEKADLKKIDNSPLPMLAQDFKKRSKDIEWPAYIQPKLNGIRCLARKLDKKTIRYTSRGGKTFLALEHLTPHLLKIMQIEETFDGELFTKELTFQEITAAVKREKTVNPNTVKLEFWIYDCIRETSFDDRTKYLRKVLTEKGPIVFVPTRLAKNKVTVMKMHQQMVEAGYEGTIVRNMMGLYKTNHRSVDLQKYKDFIDEEFKIVGGKQGVGKDEGAVTFICVTEEDKQFDCRPRGTYEQRQKWWRGLSKLLGKKLTVRYQNRTDENKPYLPVGISIRDYE